MTPECPAAGDIASLAEARGEVQACRRCPLYVNATQAVFRRGLPTSR